ncbi:hypothetical protein NP493_261g00007 [Ridgeia piscesae]|uniref:Ubiquilin-4 n=1 Tax=Ridgeia piscesae TaxID=27915 RepID=A0AAD9NXY9_RIDPI|nr:hypothetical protein NP493_261g00007 [Ridgeia piscesae]
MADGAEESGTKIKITIKTPKEKKDVEIESTALVKELKEQVAALFNTSLEQLCLIFAGKILKDPDTLTQHGIKDGLTVHLVIKSANRSQEQAAERARTDVPTAQQPNIGATPLGLGGLGGLSGLGNMGMGSANFMQMQQQLQTELMGNPEMLRQMMDSPMVQQLMSNPDVMRQLITNNPQMRELMERNPEITHMLNNPELMRQTMELARNPAMLQELMRTQDRAMSNLESIPGGFNALQRMYRDIQEPMMDAATEGFGSNPFANLVNTTAGSSMPTSGGQQQGHENTQPLPNPWAPGGTTPTPTATGTPTTGTTPAAGAGMFNTPGMQSLMSQLTQNPQLMQNMMQAPYMQSMLQSLTANPEMAQQVIGSNPMFAGNPQLQEYMRTMLPTFLTQMQNPEVQQVMTNPQALQAIMQIQQGIQTLQMESPNLVQGMGIPGMTVPPGAPPATTATSTPTVPTPPDGSTASSAGTTNTTTTSSSSLPGGTPQANPEAFNTFMAQMLQMMGTGQMQQSPEQRFSQQLEQLAGMGFVNREANIQGQYINRAMSSRPVTSHYNHVQCLLLSS